MFDPDYYSSQTHGLPDGQDPRVHFDLIGWRLGFNPAPGFSTAYYLAQNPDVWASGLNPLDHYLRFGEAEARRPLPQSREELEPLYSLSQAEFDADYYVRRYAGSLIYPDDPLHDYLAVGRLLGRWPNPAFSPTDYLFSNPDLVRNKARCGFTHYVRSGKSEGRQVRTSEIKRYKAPTELVRPYFFSRFYMEQLDKDLLRFHANWLEHYVAFGWKDGLDPSPLFSTQAYLDAVPKLADGSDDPYTHYISQGRVKGIASEPSRTPLS